MVCLACAQWFDCRVEPYLIKASALRATAPAAHAPGFGPAGPTRCGAAGVSTDLKGSDIQWLKCAVRHPRFVGASLALCSGLVDRSSGCQ